MPLNPEAPATPSTSLFSRLTNIFIAPTDVFDEIKSRVPLAANWVAPLVFSMIVGIIYTLVVFSQPAIVHGMQEAQEKKFQAMVTAGKMTQQQADQTIATVQKFMSPGVLKIFGCAGSVFASAGILFLTALIFWAVGSRALRGNFSYMKAVEAVGIATMINVLGTIVAMLLAVIYGNILITPGPSLLVSHFDAANKMHKLLAALNITMLWYVGVLSVGLARLSGTTFLKAAGWLYGIWAALTFGAILFAGGK